MFESWSIYKDEGEWYENQTCGQPILTDSRFAIDVTDSEGLRCTVSATSQDGVRYSGTYRYTEGAYPEGQVIFHRFKGPDGDVMAGEWIGGASRGKWIIRIAR